MEKGDNKKQEIKSQELTKEDKLMIVAAIDNQVLNLASELNNERDASKRVFYRQEIIKHFTLMNKI